MDKRIHICTATVLGGDGVASFTLGCVYTDENTRYSFYRRLSGPQDQSGHEELKKNLRPSDTRDRTRTILPIRKSMAHDHYLVIAKIKERLSAAKCRSGSWHRYLGRFSTIKLKDVQIKLLVLFQNFKWFGALTRMQVR